MNMARPTTARRRWLQALAVLCACAALGVPPATARQWQAVQGDIAHVTFSAAGDQPRLYCFGRQWPVKAAGDGRWQGWIGVDLQQKPGVYTILWKQRHHQARQTLKVVEGKFRISHIQVPKRMAEFDAATLARIRREIRALRAAYRAEVDANPDIRIPGRPVAGIVSTPFGAQRYVNGEPRSPHSGIDIAAPAGTPVLLPLAGKVLLTADMYLNGKTVVIGHGNGLVSVYSHLQSIAVKEGEWLKEGSLLGHVGATGRATGPHLHWGVRFHTARVNPDALLEHPATDRLRMRSSP